MHWNQGGNFFFFSTTSKFMFFVLACICFLICFSKYYILQSSFAQTVVTTVNVFGLLFIIIVGGYLAFKTEWIGYELPSG